MNPDAAMKHYVDDEGREVLVCRHGDGAMRDRLTLSDSSPPGDDNRDTSKSVRSGGKEQRE